MNFLEERILKDGVVKKGNVLKVDSFLNHQMDVTLLDKIGEEFHRRFAGLNITKVLTIEASGIAIAYAVARCFGVPMVFAKKQRASTLTGICIPPRLNLLRTKIKIRLLYRRNSCQVTIGS